MLGAAMRTKMGALENQAEQTWRSHQVKSLDEMTNVASDALENPRRSLLREPTAELPKHQRESADHLQEYQQSVQRHLLEDVHHQVRVQQDETESSVLEFCIIPFGILVSVLSAMMNASCAAFSTACVS